MTLTTHRSGCNKSLIDIRVKVDVVVRDQGLVPRLDPLLHEAPEWSTNGGVQDVHHIL